MRILVTSDWHADCNTAGVRRFEDVRNAAEATVRAANKEEVDVYLFLGDLTDPEVGAFWANLLAIKIEQQLKMKSYWLVGNHDVVEDGYGTHSMLPLSAVAKVVAQPEAILLKKADRIPEGGRDYWLVCFPYTSTARTYDPAVAFAKLADKIPPRSQVIVASHLMLEGIGPGSETQDMPRGRDVFLPVADIRERFPDCVIFNGHYHTSQEFNGVHIPGSIIRLTKGEIGNVPGYLVVDVP